MAAKRSKTSYDEGTQTYALECEIDNGFRQTDAFRAIGEKKILEEFDSLKESYHDAKISHLTAKEQISCIISRTKSRNFYHNLRVRELKKKLSELPEWKKTEAKEEIDWMTSEMEKMREFQLDIDKLINE